MELHDLKLKNQEIHQNQASHYEDLANNIFLQLTKLFISLNIFIFTFTSPVFLQIKDSSNVEKTLLFIGWIFLLISIFAGITQLLCEKRFYDENAKYYKTIAALYSFAKDTKESLDKVEEQKTAETIKGFKYKSSVVPFAI